MKYHNLSKPLSEVFEDVGALDSKEEKIDLLSKYKTKTLKFVAEALYFMDWVEVDVPKYKKNVAPDSVCQTRFSNSITRLKSVYDNRCNKKYCDKLLTLVLENINENEAAIIETFINGKKIKGISKAVFAGVYPELFSGEIGEGD